jgi:hypothetical protein
MTDPYDSARRSLEGIPAPDLWDEAERRAAAGGTTELQGGGAPDGRRRLLAAAAVAVIAVVGVAALAWPDEEGARLDTTSATEPSVTAPPTTTATIILDEVGGGNGDETGCWVGLTGDPVVLEAGPADPPLFPSGSPQPGELVLHDQVGALQVELSIPGVMVIDLIGERVEDIELTRGPALLWITDAFTQVRWFANDSADQRCGSFTVTVSGGTPDEERETAVDYADRILLSSDDAPDVEVTSTTVPASTPATTATTTPGISQSGVSGTVTAGPTCPVERPDEPCPPQPLAVHIIAIGAGGTTVAQTDSATDGRYQMALPAGRYTLRVDTGGTFPTCPDASITVATGATTVADISCDTGIR